MRDYEITRTEKKSEEPKVQATMNVPKVKTDVKETKKADVKVKTPAKAPLKTTAADLSTAGTNIATLVADYGIAPTPRNPLVAKQLKDANRALNRMKGQKQGT